MANERITEDFVRTRLKNSGGEIEFIFEEQQSSNSDIKRLLATAGKAGNGGNGSPEFIITFPKQKDLVIVVECKARINHHESANRDRPKDFAVDGVLWYAKHLSQKFNVVAIAVSGQDEPSLKISNFLWARGSDSPKPLTNKAGSVVNTILATEDYVEHAEYDPRVQLERTSDLMSFSRELHEFVWVHAKLAESEKPLLVSGSLIALRNKRFRKHYPDYTNRELPGEWLRVIEQELIESDIPENKRLNLAQPFAGIANQPQLSGTTAGSLESVLHQILHRLDENVMPAISVHHDFDVVGQFYGEFLKYTSGDGKGLGIVLTPRHITELFSHLANLGVNDKVVDPCAGTGGFLISAMKLMMDRSVSKDEILKIKKHNLIGIEYQPHMYALAASNMILRGDGKANLHQGSCFDLGKNVKEYRPNVGFINPPYAQDKASSDFHELRFVENMLDMLVEGGKGYAIIPLSCATASTEAKRRILANHTLDAVMTMPTELFYPVGVNTCIMVFTAHKPHAVSNRKTWFGYWREDGFVKTKKNGRMDINGTWEEIRDSWVESFRNGDVIPGKSVKELVDADSEWLAEAYMETDYSLLTQSDFEQVLKEHAVFKLVQGV